MPFLYNRNAISQETPAVLWVASGCVRYPKDDAEVTVPVDS